MNLFSAVLAIGGFLCVLHLALISRPHDMSVEGTEKTKERQPNRRRLPWASTAEPSQAPGTMGTGAAVRQRQACFMIGASLKSENK